MLSAVVSVPLGWFRTVVPEPRNIDDVCIFLSNYSRKEAVGLPIVSSCRGYLLLSLELMYASCLLRRTIESKMFQAVFLDFQLELSA